MGVKKLLKLLKDMNLYNQVAATTTLHDYKGKIIALDMSFEIYKSSIGSINAEYELNNLNEKIHPHLYAIFNKLTYLLKNNIFPIPIFDGKPPQEKFKTLQQRDNIKDVAKDKKKLAIDENEKKKWEKRKFKIDKNMIDECKKLINNMGLIFLQAEGEADELLAKLNRYGFTDATATDDIDIILFHGNSIIKNFTSMKLDNEEIKLNLVLEKLDINYNQFITLCICLGCDYGPSLNYESPLQLFNILKENDMNIDQFIIKCDLPNDFKIEYDQALYHIKKCVKDEESIEYTEDEYKIKSMIISSFEHLESTTINVNTIYKTKIYDNNKINLIKNIKEFKPNCDYLKQVLIDDCRYSPELITNKLSILNNIFEKEKLKSNKYLTYENCEDILNIVFGKNIIINVSS